MPRWIFALTLFALVACDETLEEHLDDLDARAMVDCGEVSDCDLRADADAVVACLRDNLAAGVPAKAVFILDIDPVAYVYAFDGSIISIEGYYELDDGPYFTEYRCADVAISGTATCSMARATECDKVREWTD